MPKDKKLVPISEAAKVLGVSIDTIRRWDKKGILHSERTDGKNRYFSIDELEKIKFSQPLAISEASKYLGISTSTLRRLEEKGLIKPERTEAGERVYDKDSLQKFLDSEYFLRQKKVEAKILEPLKDSEPQRQEKSLEESEVKDTPTNKVLTTIAHETTQDVTKLKTFRKTFYASGLFLATTFIFLVGLITLLYLVYPLDTARFFGYRIRPAQLAQKSTDLAIKKQQDEKILGANYSPAPIPALQRKQSGAVLGTILKPISNLSLNIVKQVSPQTYSQIFPKGIIEDVNDILTIDQEGNIVPLYAVKFPGSEYLNIADDGRINNLNASFVRGKIVQDQDGQLAVIKEDGTISNLTVNTSNLADESVIGGSGGVILDNSITSDDLAGASVATDELVDNSVTTAKLANGAVTTEKIADGSITSSKLGTSLAILGTDSVITSYIKDGAVTNSKLSQITDSNKVAGSAVQLSSGGGLTNNSGLSLSTSCSSNQVLVWNGSSWICANQSGSGVTSLNSLTGALTIAGGGINAISASGTTVTVTGTEADTLTSVTGRGATTTTDVTLAGVSTTGNVGVGSSLTVTSAANLSSGLTVSGSTTLSSLTTSGAVSLGGLLTLSSSGITGGGLSANCAGTSQKLLWNSSTNQFDCGIDQNSGGGGGSGGWIDYGSTVGLQTQSANVGIGTSPSLARAKVEIQGNGNTTGLTFLTHGSSGSVFGLAVLDNGNVGIGTTSPNYNLVNTGTTFLSGFVGVGSSLNVSGNVGIGGSYTGFGALSGLNVTGLTNLAGLNAGATTLGATTLTTLSSSGNVSVGGSLSVTSGANFGSSVNVSGNTLLNTLVTSGNAAIGSSLTVSSAAFLDSLQVTKSITAASLGVSGTSNLGVVNTGALTSTTINATSLSTIGNVGVGGSITGFGALNGLNVTGLTNLAGLNAQAITSTSLATGAINSSTLTTSGNVSVGGSLTSTSAIVGSAGLKVTGISDLQTINATTINATTFNTTNLTTSGNVSVGGSLTTTSAGVFSAGIKVSGNTDLTSLTVSSLTNLATLTAGTTTLGSTTATSLTTTGNVGVGGSITGFGALNGLNVTGLTNLAGLNAGASVLGSTTITALNVSNGGITNAGAVSGVTTLNTSGNVSVGGSLTTTSAIVGSAGLTITGNANTGSLTTGTLNAGAITGTSVNTATLNTTGNVGLGASVSITSNLKLTNQNCSGLTNG